MKNEIVILTEKIAKKMNKKFGGNEHFFNKKTTFGNCPQIQNSRVGSMVYRYQNIYYNHSFLYNFALRKKSINECYFLMEIQEKLRKINQLMEQINEESTKNINEIFNEQEKQIKKKMRFLIAMILKKRKRRALMQQQKRDSYIKYGF